ncbi:hypothetical protein [Methylobacter sp. BBA5.1]|uniref:hypothetical protein n=1 Tax=Methylobacter sp. BBA5.1 TaxID=1495064 RepID=UPI001268DCF1|nr:hypothetical protein [Methylobacter sp. BBA5.1]
MPLELEEFALRLLDSPIPDEAPPLLPSFPVPKNPMGAPFDRMQSACCSITPGAWLWDVFPRTIRATRSPEKVKVDAVIKQKLPV